ncbi:hypothetical protein Fcan01_02740 [Folsomia candida]|uniref:Uncharacterized protein n=1 Tax=Folsomia candida TaxID=158441 RepID=A0A226F443_FOLCA|nr:hypothetical protein Fcan01_02740 [Folsomia candida]
MVGTKRTALQIKSPAIPNLTIKKQTKTRATSAKKIKLGEITNCGYNIDIMSQTQNNQPGGSGNRGNTPITFNILSSLLKESTATLAQQLNQRFDSLDRSITNQNIKINELENEVQIMKSSFSKVSNENEALWRELNKINLVFSGIPEGENETQQDLFFKISKIIQQTTGKNISFDTGYRVGKPLSRSSRPVKIRFRSIAERNEVYSNKLKVLKPIYINEDLPHSTRKEHAIMRQKRSQLIANGQSPNDIRMDWKKRQVITRNSSQTHHIRPTHHSQNLTRGSQLSSTLHQRPKARGDRVRDDHESQTTSEWQNVDDEDNMNWTPTFVNQQSHSDAWQDVSDFSDNQNQNPPFLEKINL